MSRRKRKPPITDPSGIDWTNMARLSELGRVFQPVDPPSEDGHRAQAGTKAARVQQLPIDDYYNRGILDGIQFDAASRVYGAFIRSQVRGAPSYDGVYVQTSGPRSVSLQQLEAFDEVKSALKAIRDGEQRVVVDWIVIGRCGSPNTIDQVRNRFSLGEAICKRMLQQGLDDVARFYGLMK